MGNNSIISANSEMIFETEEDDNNGIDIDGGFMINSIM